MQLPVLGALFKSRDYINRQTELMVMVTPYIVRAVAQKELSRPDDGYADASDPAAILLGRFNRIYGVAGKGEPQEHLPRQGRLHSRLTAAPGDITDELNPSSGRAAPHRRPHGSTARAPRLRRRARGLQQDHGPDHHAGGHATTASAIRSRSRKGERTVELFVGSNRGGLTGEQRADVLAFAQTWRREATGGVVIERPAGTRNEIAAANSLHEVRSILAAAGVPPHAVEVRPYRPADPSKLATVRLNYPTMAADAGPCGLWPDDLGPTYDRQHNENRQYYNFGCAIAAQSRRHGREPADLVQPRGEVPPYTGRRTIVLDKYRRGESPATVVSRCRQGQDQRCGQMIEPHFNARRSRSSGRASTSRRRRASRSRRSARRSRPPPPSRPPARIGACGKAHVKIQMGGITAAIEAYRSSPTPNVIMIEAESRGDDILAGLDSLAEVCDAGTRVVVIGRHNDVLLYRELMRRGVSDYLIAPVGTIDVVRSICGLFSAPDAKPVGRVDRRGRRQGRRRRLHHRAQHRLGGRARPALDTVVTDLDLAFGTAGLDYNQDPPQGIADAVFSPDRIDTAFVDRLLSKCTDHLSLLAAPATLDRVYDFGAERLRLHLRFAARDHALHRARRAASVDRLDQAHAGQRRRHPDRRGARSRQSAQRQEPARLAARRAPERSSALLLPQPGRRAEAAGDQARRFRQGARGPAGGGHSVRAADCSAPPPTTAR